MRGRVLAAALVAALAGPAAGPAAPPRPLLVQVPFPEPGQVTYVRVELKAKNAKAKPPRLALVKDPSLPSTLIVVGGVVRKKGAKGSFVAEVVAARRAESADAPTEARPPLTASLQSDLPLTLSAPMVTVESALVFEAEPPAPCAGGRLGLVEGWIYLVQGEEGLRRLLPPGVLGPFGRDAACDVPAAPEPAEALGALSCKFTLTRTAETAGNLEGSCSRETGSVTFGALLAALLERAASAETSCGVVTFEELLHIACAGAPAKTALRIEVGWSGPAPDRLWAAPSPVPRPGEAAPSLGPFAVLRVGF